MYYKDSAKYIFWKQVIVYTSLAKDNGELSFFVILSYLQNPPLGQDMAQGQFSSGV